jgi:hypothetical protein
MSQVIKSRFYKDANLIVNVDANEIGSVDRTKIQPLQVTSLRTLEGYSLVSGQPFHYTLSDCT